LYRFVDIAMEVGSGCFETGFPRVPSALSGPPSQECPIVALSIRLYTTVFFADKRADDTGELQ
jgi:hypothetical protein